MKLLALAALASACASVASPVLSNPFKRQASGPTDIQVLQYALTLENLEAAFYKQALDKFSAKDFADAGFPDWVRGRTSQIAQHEASHVKLLSAALGNQTVAPCTYAFGLTTPAAFINQAAFVENLGVSAYSGANQYISSSLYRTVAATILSVEARHQGFFNGPVERAADWTGPYDTPLGLDMVYTLAAQYISSCPSTNAALPVVASTPLLSAGSPFAAADGGMTLPLTYAKSSSSVAGPVNAVIYNGLGSAFLPFTNGAVTIPAAIQGYSYIILTNAKDAASVTTANTVAGPLELTTVFNAFQSNPGFMNPFNS